MSRILIIVHAPAYGSERMLSALRLATTLMSREDEIIELSVFMMSDAVTAGLPNQAVAEGAGSLQSMIEDLTQRGVKIRLCRTCALARGIVGLSLIDGVEIATLDDLAEFTLQADKILTF